MVTEYIKSLFTDLSSDNITSSSVKRAFEEKDVDHLTYDGDKGWWHHYERESEPEGSIKNLRSDYSEELQTVSSSLKPDEVIQGIVKISSDLNASMIGLLFITNTRFLYAIEDEILINLTLDDFTEIAVRKPGFNMYLFSAGSPKDSKECMFHSDEQTCEKLLATLDSLKCLTKYGEFTTGKRETFVYDEDLCNIYEKEKRERKKKAEQTKRERENRKKAVRNLTETYIEGLSDSQLQVYTQIFALDYIQRGFNRAKDLQEVEKRLQDIQDESQVEGIDHYEFQSLCDKATDSLSDIRNLKKLLNKKHDVYAPYWQIINEITAQAKEKLLDEAISPEIERLKNKLSSPYPRELLKEYVNSPLNRDNSLMRKSLAKKVLRAFELDIPPDLRIKLVEIKEEQELRSFEQNLGKKSDNSYNKPNFQEMNGSQFEDALEELFEARGHTAYQTKNGPDQGADLIVQKENEKTAVQAKRYKDKVSNDAIQQVVAAQQHYDCEKALVVTTSGFTRSAEELAVSNNVELWNQEKLEQKADQVQNNSLQAHQGSTVQRQGNDAYITVECPFCNSEFSLFQEDLPRKGETKLQDCPSCGFELTLNLHPDQYDCKGCGKSFQDAIVRTEHEESCDSYQEQSYNCDTCEEEFILNDEELSNLQENGYLEVNCPSCGTSNQL